MAWWLALMVWYLWLLGVGWLVWPLVWRLFPRLPSRGWPYRRTLGLLVWGYLFWLPTVLGWTTNSPATMLSVLVLLAGMAVYWGWPRRQRLIRWLAQERPRVLASELVFTLAFLAWTVVRAANPEAFSTEKPMEMAFIHAILRSPTFPPHDPWLAGYAISYYHFGYILVAMLAQLSGAPGSVAFNLGLVTVFALAAEVAAGLVWDLVASQKASPSPWAMLLGPLFVLLIGNWEAVLEVLHQKGLFWKQVHEVWVSPFWTWTQIPALTQPPRPPFGFRPARFWWWWQASRVVQDYTPTGQRLEVIDEFPFFSFLLGDLHPHVLGIPFLLTWLGVLFHRYRGGLGPYPGSRKLETLLLAVYLGGLAFLNAWDWLTAFALLFLVLFWRAVSHRERSWALHIAGRTGLVVGLLGFLLYLPYHLSFSSQVRGVLPNLLFPTRGFHLWVMFGPLLTVLALGLLYRARALGLKRILQRGLPWTGGVFLALNLAAWVMALVAWMVARPWAAQVLQQLAVGSLGEVFRVALARRVAYGAGLLTLALFFAGTMGLALEAQTRARAVSEGFTALVVAWATLLVWIPDYLYIWDVFGTRMNTVFKFYYQAWLLWAVVAAVWSRDLLARRPAARLELGLWLAALGLALIYPILSLPDRAQGFRNIHQWTLDSLALVARANPGEARAIQYLRSARPGVVAEAVGGSYTQYARMSTYSGLPTVLGWPGHEIQWRGSSQPLGTREADMARLYTTTSWEEARRLLERYGIRYVVVGPLERNRYPVHEALFKEHLPLLFAAASTRIYGYTPASEGPR